MSVLLVVADDVLRAEWSEQLHAAEVRVTALGSEDDARRYLLSFTPGLIVYHAARDDEDTRRFLYDISVRESGPQIGVLVLSATSGSTSVAEDCGFHVLAMPVDHARLCAEVTRLAPHSKRRPSAGRT